MGPDKKTRLKIGIEPLLVLEMMVSPSKAVETLLRRLLDRRDSTEPSVIEEKLKGASEAMAEAGAYLQSMQASLREQQERLKTAREAYEHYQLLADTEEKKAKALLTEMAGVLTRTTRKERYIAFAINIIAGLVIFIIGVMSSQWLGQLWNRMYNSWSSGS